MLLSFKNHFYVRTKERTYSLKGELLNQFCLVMKLINFANCTRFKLHEYLMVAIFKFLKKTTPPEWLLTLS